MSRKFTVTEKAMRPGSPEKQCFYCQEPIGAAHNDDCVLINKTVKIAVTFEIEVDVPVAWAARDVEFFYNESSNCADNLLDNLQRAAEQDCLCDRTSVKVIGSANAKARLEE